MNSTWVPSLVGPDWHATWYGEVVGAHTALAVDPAEVLSGFGCVPGSTTVSYWILGASRSGEGWHGTARIACGARPVTTPRPIRRTGHNRRTRFHKCCAKAGLPDRRGSARWARAVDGLGLDRADQPVSLAGGSGSARR